jgi:hypothetical protein
MSLVMDKPLIEVFVEEFCPACKEVLHNLQSLASSGLIAMEIFCQGRDNAVFEERNVSICPATFVNRRLAFYGEFALVDLRHCLFRHQEITDD